MKYLLLVTVDSSIEPTAEDLALIEPWLELTKKARLEGSALHEPATAKTVRLRGGKRMVTDGPFAETKEHVGGFDIIECDTLEEAVEIAAAHPVARFGAIEVREFRDL